MSRIYDGIEDDVNCDDIGPSRPFNSDAAPGDDDYDPRLNDMGNVYRHVFEINLNRLLPIAARQHEIVRKVDDNI